MYLKAAKDYIIRLIGNIEKSSSVYETQPWGFVHDTPFLNQLIIAGTLLEPLEVMQTILNIENNLGRVRKKDHYSARTIDIDILFYDNRIINEKDLVIPHPQLHKRRFALEPLAEVEPGLVHPVLKKTVTTLLSECDDPMNVNNYTQA